MDTVKAPRTSAYDAGKARRESQASIASVRASARMTSAHRVQPQRLSQPIDDSEKEVGAAEWWNAGMVILGEVMGTCTPAI